jgi:DNA repair exonuclease SbcCD ATPase subunit
MIRRLAMRDFKVFHDQTLEFGPGTTCVVGPNGSGKTTILEAIEFALFRQVTRKEKKVPRFEDLIRHGESKAVVELDFVAPLNRREYRVERTIQEKATTADLFNEGEEKAFETGPSRVDMQIVGLLGMDRNAFSALTYVRQGEIDQLSRLTPKERKAHLFDMMGLGVYNKTSAKAQVEIRDFNKSISAMDDTAKRLGDILGHLPTAGELKDSLAALERLSQKWGETPELMSLQKLLKRVQASVESVQRDLKSPELEEKARQLDHELGVISDLRTLLETIPEIAEEQLRPHIRAEARQIFLDIFGDRYSDFAINEDYEIVLYDLQGNKVSLMAASGGEDVCVNFALRVAVNTALQKHSVTGSPPGFLVLDEPGAGLDAQRRRWLPEAVAGLSCVEQVIVVTHMDELRESANRVISLTPQGRGRQPLVEIQE